MPRRSETPVLWWWNRNRGRSYIREPGNDHALGEGQREVERTPCLSAAGFCLPRPHSRCNSNLDFDVQRADGPVRSYDGNRVSVGGCSTHGQYYYDEDRPQR